MLAGILLIAALLSGCINSNNSQASSNAEKFDVSIKVISSEKTLVDQTIAVEKGKTALQALQSVSLVDTKDYSFGKFIASISGINASSSEYWAFYVNGEYAQVGADAYKIEAPASFEFKIEKLQ